MSGISLDKVLQGKGGKATQQFTPAPFINPFDTKNPEAFRFQFIRECFDGSGGFANGQYIIQKPLTDVDTYKRLQVDSFYSNQIEKIIKDQTQPVFRVVPESTWNENAEKAELFRSFLENVNRIGVSINEYMPDAGVDAKLQSFVGILVDGPKEDELSANRSLSKQIENRVYPTASTIMPDRFIDDWTLLDSKDNLMRVAYWMDIGSSKFVREWTLDTIRLYSKEEWDKGTFDDDPGTDEFGNTPRIGVPQEEELNLIEEVPIIRYYGNQTKFLTFIPFPVNWSLAKLQYRLYNCDSDIAYMEWGQTHSTLAVPSNGVNVAGTGPGVAIQFDKDRGEPFYLSPDGTQFENIMAYRESLVRDMFRIGRLSSLHMGETNASSGEAKKKDFEITNQHLKWFSNKTEWVQEEIGRLFGKWVGSDFEYEVTYPQTFFDTDSMEIIAETIEIVMLNEGKSETAVKMAIEKANRAFFGKDSDFLETINDELEKARLDRIQNPPEPEEGETVPPEEDV